MVKVIFENIERSFYDNTKKELHLRENLIGNKEELAKVLEHETEHIRKDDRILNRFSSKYLNFLYEWLIERKWIIYVILIPASIYLQFYTNNYTLSQALNTCNSELANTSVKTLITNFTFH